MSTKHRTPVELQARLARAIDRVETVRVMRGIRGADVLSGYVLATSPKWTLLATLGDDWALDGHACIRTNDVTRVQRHRRHDFAVRLLTGRGQWPPPAPPTIPPLDRTSAMLESLSAQSPTTTVFVEHDDPEVCFIGVPVEWSARAMWLRELSPNAIWDDTVSKWRYRDITRVDVGCRYEAALFEVSGPPPGVVEPPT